MFPLRNGYVQGGTKDESEDLVDDLLDAMGELLEENTWMTQTTIELALDNLGLMIPMVAYNESILNKEGHRRLLRRGERKLLNPLFLILLFISLSFAKSSDIGASTHFDNVANTIDFNVARYQGALRESTDRGEWITPAAVVNAFYSPEHNSICEGGKDLLSPLAKFEVTIP